MLTNIIASMEPKLNDPAIPMELLLRMARVVADAHRGLRALDEIKIERDSQ